MTRKTNLGFGSKNGQGILIFFSDVGKDLRENYCRNPSSSDERLERPWCYVDKNCQIEYCDVCNLGNMS